MSLYSQDKRAIDSLLNVSKSAIHDTSKTRAFCLLCYEYSSYDSILSKQYGDIGIVLADKIGFEAGKAQCLYNLSVMYRQNSDYITSIEHVQKAIAIRKKLGDKNRAGNGTRDLGTCYLKLGKYELSLKYYFAALKIFESIDNQNSIYNTYCGIAEVYYLDGNFTQAIKQLEEALAISKKLNDSLYISNAYMNLGLLTGENNDNETGLKYLKESLKICEKLNQKETLEGIYLNMGLLYSKIGDNKNAISYYEKCLKIAKEKNIEEDIAIVLSNLSQIYSQQGNYNLAVQYGEQSFELSKKIKLKDKIKDATENLAEANSKLGNFEKAFYYQKINSNMKDSLYSEDRQTAIAEIQTKYDVDKKEKENQLLNQQVELQMQDSKLQKIVLLSIILFTVLILALAFSIFKSYRQKKQANLFLEFQNKEIVMQKEIIEVKNKDITDSINYARRIQASILPMLESIQQHLPRTFILYKPKDIVSGDFYWFTEKYGYLFIVVADCTGHGVPGAFMSMIGNDMLSQVITEKSILQPNLILSALHDGIKKALKQDEALSKSKDGMDIAIVRIKNNETIFDIEYAGALRPLWVIQNKTKELKEYKPDKYSVGGAYTTEKRNFTNVSFKLIPGDSFYLTTDGYSDQFGGEKGKKLKSKKLQQILVEIAEKTAVEQKTILSTTIENWKGNLEQVDDILVVGIKV